MKKILKLSLFSILFAALVIACTKEDDDDIDFISEYSGSWNAKETEGINAPQAYNVSISRGSNDEEIIISNLYISGTKVKANISGFNFSIPSQTTNNISFEGTGSASADFDKITINFTANDGTGDDFVKAILTP